MVLPTISELAHAIHWDRLFSEIYRFAVL